MHGSEILARSLRTHCTRSRIPSRCIHCALAQTAIGPQSMKALAQVRVRYVSYDVETVEVIGGRFTALYRSRLPTRLPTSPCRSSPAGSSIRIDEMILSTNCALLPCQPAADGMVATDTVQAYIAAPAAYCANHKRAVKMRKKPRLRCFYLSRCGWRGLYS